MAKRDARQDHGVLARPTRRFLFFFEVIQCDFLDFVRDDRIDPNVEVDHELGELTPVDQNNFWLDVLYIVPRITGEGARGYEYAFLRSFSVECAYEFLNLWPADSC